MDERMHEQAAVLALVQASPGEWYQTADVIAEAGSAIRLLDGPPVIMPEEGASGSGELISRVKAADVPRAEALIDRVTSQGVRLITILDEDYPENLKLIFNRPPFIWVRGQLRSRSLRAIAVVGTRQATPPGCAAAARLAEGLAVLMHSAVRPGARHRHLCPFRHHRRRRQNRRRHRYRDPQPGISGREHGAGPRHRSERRGHRLAVLAGGSASEDQLPAPEHRDERHGRRNGRGRGGRPAGRKCRLGWRSSMASACSSRRPLVRSEAWAGRYATRPGVTVVGDFGDILDELVKVVEIPCQMTLSF